jgi:Secretion system C-terminal sorting domain
MKKITTYFTLVLGTLFSPSVHGQMTTDTLSGSAQLSTFLAGAGINITNLTVNCPSQAIGTFMHGSVPSNLNMGAGLVMSTGFISEIPGPNDITSTSGITNGISGDTDMNAVCGQQTFDGCIVEFDIVPSFSNILFNYIFASEEYNEWVGSPFNDAFAIFFSGPGFPQQNVALIPSTTTPVTVNNVNMGANPTYYVDNDSSIYYPGDSSRIEMDGMTTNLTALIPGLVASSTYHFKIGVADASDQVLDAAVFLQAASFRRQELTGVDAASLGVKLSVSPNPSSGMLDLNLAGLRPGEEISFTLHDLTGRIAFESGNMPHNGNGSFSSDLSKMPSGIYLVTVHTEKGDVSTRWIRE